MLRSIKHELKPNKTQQTLCEHNVDGYIKRVPRKTKLLV